MAPADRRWTRKGRTIEHTALASPQKRASSGLSTWRHVMGMSDSEGSSAPSCRMSTHWILPSLPRRSSRRITREPSTPASSRMDAGAACDPPNGSSTTLMDDKRDPHVIRPAEYRCTIDMVSALRTKTDLLPTSASNSPSGAHQHSAFTGRPLSISVAGLAPPSLSIASPPPPLASAAKLMVVSSLKSFSWYTATMPLPYPTHS
mmetsp:Transcript_18183/g.51767  ORF Transcript_18183/g.51767 Transcript_18183/m.51767 type:complete len:204 (+) Transcript_18183:177-788(+)